MLYLKACAVGLVTGLLAPIVVAVASRVTFMAMLVFSGGAATGGGGSGPSFGVGVEFGSSSGPFVTQVVIGFAIGFLFTLWRAMVKHQTGSTKA